MSEWMERTASIIAIIIVIAICALLGFGKAVPTELWAFGSIVIGFFFGVQTGTARARAR